MSLEAVIILVVVLALNLFLLKMKIPLLQILVGVVTIVIMFLASDTPYFPFSNLIIGVVGIAGLLDSVNALR